MHGCVYHVSHKHIMFTCQGCTEQFRQPTPYIALGKDPHFQARLAVSSRLSLMIGTSCLTRFATRQWSTVIFPQPRLYSMWEILGTGQVRLHSAENWGLWYFEGRNGLCSVLRGQYWLLGPLRTSSQCSVSRSFPI